MEGVTADNLYIFREMLLKCCYLWGLARGLSTNDGTLLSRYMSVSIYDSSRLWL